REMMVSPRSDSTRRVTGCPSKVSHTVTFSPEANENWTHSGSMFRMTGADRSFWITNRLWLFMAYIPLKSTRRSLLSGSTAIRVVRIRASTVFSGVASSRPCQSLEKLHLFPNPLFMVIIGEHEVRFLECFTDEAQQIGIGSLTVVDGIAHD